MKNNLLLVVSVAIVVGVSGFFAGMKYQQSQQPSKGNFQAMRGARQDLSGGGSQAGSEMVRGEIISQDGESITINLSDESSKLVLISENTEINKATEGSIDDLKSGEQVMIFGKKNADESISATQIQLNFGLREVGQPQ